MFPYFIYPLKYNSKEYVLTRSASGEYIQWILSGDSYALLSAYTSLTPVSIGPGIVYLNFWLASINSLFLQLTSVSSFFNQLSIL